jgi:hypothetical protein
MVRVCMIGLHRREPVSDSGDSLIPVLLNHPSSHDPNVARHQHNLRNCAYRQVNNAALMVNDMRETRRWNVTGRPPREL